MVNPASQETYRHSGQIILNNPEDTVSLKQLMPEDSDAYFSLIDFDRDHLRQHGDTTAEKYRSAADVQDSIINPSNPDKFRFGIWDGETLVGSDNLTPLGDGTAELGSWVGKQYVGNMYASRGRTLLADFAFHQLGMRKVLCNITVGNEASRRSVEKSGFVYAGEKDGQWVYVLKNPNTNEYEGLTTEELVATMDADFTHPDGLTASQAWQYREEVRGKYGLPECGGLWSDPQGYINEIEAFLEREGIRIRGKHEFKDFFNNNPGAGAVAFGRSVFRDATVVVGQASSSDWFGLRARAKQLSHESVHAMQDKYYPGMPDEQAEREAYYYQMFTPQKIRELSDDPEHLLFIITGIIEPAVRSSVTINASLKG